MTEINNYGIHIDRLRTPDGPPPFKTNVIYNPILDLDDSPPRDPATGEPLEGRGPKLRAANDTLHWHRYFRELVAHPRVAPILEELCGHRYRLDHVRDPLRLRLLSHAVARCPRV